VPPRRRGVFLVTRRGRRHICFALRTFIQRVSALRILIYLLDIQYAVHAGTIIITIILLLSRRLHARLRRMVSFARFRRRLLSLSHSSHPLTAPVYFENPTGTRSVSSYRTSPPATVPRLSAYNISVCLSFSLSRREIVSRSRPVQWYTRPRSAPMTTCWRHYGGRTAERANHRPGG